MYIILFFSSIYKTLFLYLLSQSNLENAQCELHICYVYKELKFLKRLGPGRPLAGGPRMDCWVVTSPGVVKVSRLASRLWCSARRGQGGLK